MLLAGVGIEWMPIFKIKVRYRAPVVCHDVTTSSDRGEKFAMHRSIVMNVFATGKYRLLHQLARVR